MSTAAHHPEALAALAQLQEMQAVLSDQLRQVTEGVHTGTDEHQTVEVTVDGSRWLKSIFIKDGLLRLGADEVQNRINEAMGEAQAKASAALQAQQGQLYANLQGITASLRDGLGLG
ncbi:YbaB/EbfC family nucleoid-associated protein [Mycolicibacterium sp. S2-37]|uniref:YbaB/EbfC family nucleoid-associated protein n=1 Tax=Mycolicibacterium sp. S2-37 TaxID=2810297 RepID=UPI001A93E3B2|nr:YbaB/EbfC family nucleoid-associated protein [Mycolicibacterium sp. S2-37]MBO0677350.1 YbaB/EbfC family nucleoid-associated protein [Mycolicibacterium sp. S2-37]